MASTKKDKDEIEEIKVGDSTLRKIMTEEQLYELDPKLVDPNVIINAGKCPMLINITKLEGGSIRLVPGQRLFGKEYRYLIEEERIPSLQFANKLSKEHLIKLEKTRQERIQSNDDAEWARYAHSQLEKA